MENIADRIIRDTLSEIEEAVPFFKSTLPIEVVNVLNFNTLNLAPTTYISDDLKEYRSDLLFQIQMIDSSPAQIYILFEHKSTQDKRIFTQLLSYLVPHLL